MAARNQTYRQLATAFRRKKFEPLYFLYGEERFFAEELQAILLANALAPHERDFNLDIAYGAEADVQDVLARCAAYPVMAERRVVIVRDFDKMKDNQRFKAFAQHPNPSAIVVLACHSKPNLSAHPYRALRERAVTMEGKPLRNNQVPKWIRKRVEAMGHTIGPEAAQVLADRVGTKLGNVVGELEKLITSTGGREAITVEDVIDASGQTRAFNVFELQRAVGEQRRADAFRIAERMLQQGSNVRGEALMIVSVLNAYFTRLWKLAGCKRGTPEQELAKHVGVSPYFIKEYAAGLRRYRLPAIHRSFSALLAADHELKGGSARSEQLIMVLALRRILSMTP